MTAGSRPRRAAPRRASASRRRRWSPWVLTRRTASGGHPDLVGDAARPARSGRSAVEARAASARRARIERQRGCHASCSSASSGGPMSLPEHRTRPDHADHGTAARVSVTGQAAWPGVRRSPADRPSAGPGLDGPGLERLVGGDDQRQLGDRVDPQEACRTAPKWPKVAGELAGAGPVRASCSRRISKPRPQSLGSWRPKPGRTPSRPGKATVVACGEGAGVEQRWARSSSAASAAEVGGGRRGAVGRRAVEGRWPPCPSGSSTASAR